MIQRRRNVIHEFPCITITKNQGIPYENNTPAKRSKSDFLPENYNTFHVYKKFTNNRSVPFGGRRVAGGTVGSPILPRVGSGGGILAASLVDLDDLDRRLGLRAGRYAAGGLAALSQWEGRPGGCRTARPAVPWANAPWAGGSWTSESWTLRAGPMG